MNISKVMKKKRDAEKRLNQTSPQPVFVSGGGSGGGDIYLTEQQIINNITNVFNRLIEGDNIVITDNLDGTYTISGESGGNSMELLTNGDVENTELIFADGDVLWGVE